MRRRREGVDITLGILFVAVLVVLAVVCCGTAWVIGAWAA